MRAVSLFAGIGGFDLAAQRCGVDAAVQVEIDAFCRRVLAKRFPRARRFKDVREVTGREIGATDLLCGGFPCQDVSVAGKRAGLAGERTGLFWQIVRLADECRPRWLLLENVPGLLSSGGGRDFGAVLGALGELGYGYAWRVLDAQFFGVAQRRRRVFIVGCLGDAGRAAKVLFEPASCARHPAPRREAGTRVAGCLEAGANRTGGTRPPGTTVDTADSLVTFGREVGFTLTGDAKPCGGHMQGWNTDFVSMPLLAKGNDSHAEDLQTYVPACSPALLSSRAGYRSDLETEAFVTHALTGEGHDASEDGTGRGTPLLVCGASDPILAVDLSFPLTGRHGDTTAMAWDRTQITSKVNRTHPSPEAPPLNCSGGVMVGVRRLMPVEAERLQAFPDGWTCLKDHPQQCDCPDSPRYRALGNAVCVNVVTWILQRLVAVDAASLEQAA